MRHALHKSFVLKACLWRNSTRGIASEPVVQCHSGADRNSTLGQRWLEHENEVLLKAIQKQEHLIEKAENPSAESHRRLKWEEIETFCHSEGIFRSAEQCRNRWQRLLNAFNRVKSWESCRSPTKTSFWAMKASDRKSGGLPPTFDRSTFDFIDLIQNRKDISRSMVASAAGEEATAENPSSEKLDNHDCSKQCAESQHTRESDHLEAKRFAGVQRISMNAYAVTMMS
ncbi:hypothetical protein KP509_28G055100 [Ceratopteris richardii]|uniref:Myb-like domain-containing protein n=1 Tax=Ceratopteris richardii TaxID=49495 RepID=A0A8T2REV6_CERRI|nr:hypothetical protein KP509_28G055100 [Ceratopteris richardii]